MTLKSKHRSTLVQHGRIAVAVLATLAAFFTAPLRAQPAPAEESLEQAAQRIVAHYQASWNAGDGAANAESFVDDADFRVWNGIFATGKAAIAENHQRIFDTFYKDTRLSVEILKIRPITDRVGAIHLAASLERLDGGPVGFPPGMTGARPLMILARQDDGEWKVEVFQNTPYFEQRGRPEDGDS
jgi:uncharacterized protein (TIGR02246 family)